MSFGEIMAVVWVFLNSAQGIVISIAVLGYVLNKIYSKKPLWKKYEGTVIAGIKASEKAIDDNTPNRPLAKLDRALQYIIKVIEAKENRDLTKVEKTEIEESISVVHSELEAMGGLKKNDVVS